MMMMMMMMENKCWFFAFSCGSEKPQNTAVPNTMKGRKSRQEIKGISRILRKTVNETWNRFRKLYNSTCSTICNARIITRAIENRRHRRAISNFILE